MRLVPVVTGFLFCILAIVMPAKGATFTTELGNGDVASLILLLICGIILGGVVSVVRTRSRGEASK